MLEGERELKEESALLSDPEKNDRIKDYKTLLEDHVLIDLPNVLVTPHIAFFTKEAVLRIKTTTAENIQAYISGKPINLV